MASSIDAMAVDIGWLKCATPGYWADPDSRLRTASEVYTAWLNKQNSEEKK